jgi:signal peptidase II
MRLLAPICGLVLLDQWSKHWIQRRLLYGERIEVWPGIFDIRHVRNTGAAWGMLAGWRLLLILFAAGMLALIVRRRHELFDGWRGGQAALALLVAGIAGNLIDRVRLGYVVDFLDFYRQAWHFPAFNVADSAICVGIGLYLLGQLRPSARAAAADPA